MGRIKIQTIVTDNYDMVYMNFVKINTYGRTTPNKINAALSYFSENGILIKSYKVTGTYVKFKFEPNTKLDQSIKYKLGSIFYG